MIKCSLSCAIKYFYTKQAQHKSRKWWREIRILFEKYYIAKYSAIKGFLKLSLAVFNCIYGKCSENVVKLLSIKLTLKKN